MYNDIYTYTVLVSYISLRVIYILQDIILDSYIYNFQKQKEEKDDSSRFSPNARFCIGLKPYLV